MSTAGSQETEAERSTEYIIRRFEDADREAFLSLYESVFGGDVSDRWFDWRFVENPFVDHVPMFVAEQVGELVGARPFLCFQVEIGSRTLLGIQTCDTMVHPDHRRKGLFTRMTDRAYDYYRSLDDPVLQFSIPNRFSRPGYLKLGCEVVCQLPVSYRVQRLDSMVGNDTLTDVAGALQPVVSVYNAARDRLTAPSADADISVTAHDQVPSEMFADLYRSAVPNRIHATRNEAFYEWRFDNPRWDYRAYIARRDGEPVAGVVTGTRTADGQTWTQLTDVVPLLGGDRRRPALTALLRRILSDAAETDLVSVRNGVIPQDLLTAFGFHRDDRLPLSAVTTPTILITNLLGGEDDQWVVDGHDLLDPTSWKLSFSEHNTS